MQGEPGDVGKPGHLCLPRPALVTSPAGCTSCRLYLVHFPSSPARLALSTATPPHSTPALGPAPFQSTWHGKCDEMSTCPKRLLLLRFSWSPGGNFSWFSSAAARPPRSCLHQPGPPALLPPAPLLATPQWLVFLGPSWSEPGASPPCRSLAGTFFPQLFPWLVSSHLADSLTQTGQLAPFLEPSVCLADTCHPCCFCLLFSFTRLSAPWRQAPSSGLFTFQSPEPSTLPAILKCVLQSNEWMEKLNCIS